MAHDWGGFAAVYSTLSFWRGWLASSLKHSSDAGSALNVLTRFYVTADPLASALLVALLLALLCFVASLPTNRHSWVDKLWSIAPVYYFWHFALHDRVAHGAGVPLSPRLVAMAALASLWGARLTYNFARKGGYRWAEEDYRWPYIRARVHPALFLIFNATFIALIQHLLLLAICAPAYVAWQNVSRPQNALDIAATLLVAIFILFEAVADEQQWAFQTAKHAALRARRRLPPAFARGFLTEGLFRYSRHPNFWAEQCIWWSMHLFSVASSGRWLNWTIAGPLALSALFQGSTWLTELMTASKYPAYKAYQRSTSRLMPWFPGPSLDAAKEEQAAPAARTPRASSRRRAAAAATPAAPAEPESDGERKAAPRASRSRATAPATTTATKRRAAKAAPVVEAYAAEEAAPPPTTSTRPTRSPRKSAKALAADMGPAPTRQSSRLRSRSRGSG